jgi:hypothetical protein
MRPASASLARRQIASTAPLESPITNRSDASSLAPRREIRCRAVNVMIAACNRGPNAEPPIPAGSRAVALLPQHEQRSRCVRCSISSTLIGGSSAI